MNAELVSIRTLAELMDCSPKTIRDWLYKSRRDHGCDPLPYYRLGGLIRFRLAEVVPWIERRRVRLLRHGPEPFVATRPAYDE